MIDDPGKLFQLPSGGPSVICGQGGKAALRLVNPPLPSGKETTTGGKSRLGDAIKPLVAWSLMFTFEYGRPPPDGMVTGGKRTTMVVMVV